MVQKDDSSEDGAPSGVGTSSEVVGIEPICTNIETTSQIIEMITESNCLHPAGVSWKDISLDHSSPQKQIDVALPAICGNKNSKSCCIVQSVKIEPVHFPPTLGSLQSQRRRKPCNGWISSEDEVDNVFLMTDALPRQPTSRGGRMDCGRKRKMRWDVKPEDM
ncbi:hypothetical protein HHK36_010770 [Tetracentron sinense]|uniref:Uncharacterized protein n=1 Tax=Tetracentron sinense TaxID=13715 RepID=A0A834ZEX7_TETSI|nr:hypothetical protein HHK36_010770 [Tetracentron sinense]